MNASLKALLNEQYKLVAELREENRKLKEENEELHKIRDNREEKIADLEIEICKLKEDIKSLESAIGDVVRENRRLKEERIFSLGEYDYMILTSTTPKLKIIKKNQNYSLMEEDTLQELRDLGKI